MHIQQMKAYKIMWKFFIEPSDVLEISRIQHFDFIYNVVTVRPNAQTVIKFGMKVVLPCIKASLFTACMIISFLFQDETGLVYRLKSCM